MGHDMSVQYIVVLVHTTNILSRGEHVPITYVQLSDVVGKIQLIVTNAMAIYMDKSMYPLEPNFFLDNGKIVLISTLTLQKESYS